MPSLRVRTPDGVQLFPLSQKPATLGRSDACDVVLPSDAEVSREHARVWIDDDGQIMVCDVDSKNGTRVDDGQPFRRATYRASRNIRIGDYVIELLDVQAPPAASPSRPVRFSEQDVNPQTAQYFPSSRAPDLGQQRLAMLMELTARIGGVFEKQQLIEQALDTCMEALKFERGLLALRSQRGEPEQPISRNVQRDESGAFKISRTLINRALIDGERAVVNNPATDLVNNLSESLVRFPICSALCVPIVHRNEILGVIYGDRVTRAATYDAGDVDFFAAIAQQVGVGIANLRMLEDHVKSQKMFAALQQARALQQRLLPCAPLRHERLWIEGCNHPSASVSGDYYDYFRLSDELVGFVIADVTGHGMPAALLMANFQAAVRVGLTANADLPELAERLNRHVHSNTSPGVFVTAILGRLNTITGELEYISAGHPGPIMLAPEGPRLVKEHDDNTSLPFGVIADDDYFLHRLPAQPGINRALLYTDGLSEATAEDGKLLGVEVLLRETKEFTRGTPAEIISGALAIVRRHIGKNTPYTDDLTLLAIQYERT